jgi:hypothetical protein
VKQEVGSLLTMLSRAIAQAASGIMQAMRLPRGMSQMTAPSRPRFFSGKAEGTAPTPAAPIPTAAQEESTEGGGAEAPKSGDGPSNTDVKKKQEWYSTTPLILDSRSTAPLKSAEYASSHDDKFGVQKNWFTSLYKQLNYFAKTGAVPGLKGRQREVREI